MTIMITGSTGMVGSNLSRILSASYELFCPSRQQLDLQNGQLVQEYLKSHRPDVIVHCAGRVGGIQANMADPASFLVENVSMGLNLLMAGHEHGIQRILNLGSSCMYPRDAENPLKEEKILTGELEPTNEAYALAKIAVQRLCAYLTHSGESYSYRTIIPCNLFGPGDSFDLANSHMIPAAIRKLHYAQAEQQEFVEIWGDGSARREFMYVDELCRFIKLCIERYDDVPDVVNVGVGRDYTIQQYYDIIADVVGFKGKFKYNLNKPTGMRQKLVDITLATESLGWQPKSDLRAAIQKTYSYFLSLLGKVAP